MASFTTNANVVQLILSTLTTNADIQNGYQRTFTTNATIIGADSLALTTNAYIADLIALGLPTNAYIVATQTVQITTNASIRGPVSPLALTTNAMIVGPATLGLLTSAYIADLIALEFTTNASISGTNDDSLTTNATIATTAGISFTTSADILNNRYWAIGQDGLLQDISGRVCEPAARGFGIKTSTRRLPGGRRTILRDEGLDGCDYEFYVLFQTDAARQGFHQIVNNDAVDLIVHRGRSDRYQHIKKTSVEPGEDDLWRGVATLKINCLLEDPYLYHSLDQGIDLGACALQFSTTTVYNHGSAEAPILFKIGGLYFGGQLTFPVVKCIDGATEETSLALGPGLLSNEYAELTREGSQKYYLTHTYDDLYSTNNYWQYDAAHSLCSLAGGQVSVPSGGWFYYKFQGYPTKENITLLATITKSGSPIIQYSTDGTTWVTTVAATEIVSGVQTEYYLTGTEKLSTVYVRFYSPAGSSMTIQDVSFSVDRDISAQYLQIPMVPAVDTRSLTISGAGSNKAKIRYTFRSRWHPT